MAQHILFIALLPDEEIQREVTEFKLECQRQFGASHALKSPPHITLQAPFRWPSERVGDLEISLLGFAERQMSFLVNLENFNCFRPRVIYVDVQKNDDLSELQSELEKHLEQEFDLVDPRRGRGFHPHMTIAHRDLKQGIFPAAWAHFSKKKYSRQFLADRLTLLRHRDGRWHSWREFEF